MSKYATLTEAEVREQYTEYHAKNAEMIKEAGDPSSAEFDPSKLIIDGENADEKNFNYNNHLRTTLELKRELADRVAQREMRESVHKDNISAPTTVSTNNDVHTLNSFVELPQYIQNTKVLMQKNGTMELVLGGQFANKR